MKTEIKKLFQMFEESAAEQRAERAQAVEMTDLKIDAIQQAIAQLLNSQNKTQSPYSEYQHGENSNHDQKNHTRLPY